MSPSGSRCVKPERIAEEMIYRGIPRLISESDWNESVPAFKSVIVMVPQKVFNKGSDTPGGCADGKDKEGNGWVDLNETE